MRTRSCCAHLTHCAAAPHFACLRRLAVSQFEKMCENASGKSPAAYGDDILDMDHWGSEIELAMFAITCNRVCQIGNASRDAFGNLVFIPSVQVTPPDYDFSFGISPYRFVHVGGVHYDGFDESVPALQFRIDAAAAAPKVEPMSERAGAAALQSSGTGNASGAAKPATSKHVPPPPDDLHTVRTIRTRTPHRTAGKCRGDGQSDHCCMRTRSCCAHLTHCRDVGRRARPLAPRNPQRRSMSRHRPTTFSSCCKTRKSGTEAGRRVTSKSLLIGWCSSRKRARRASRCR